MDSEYEVVAIEEGKGKMAGKAMFVCDAGDGKTFRVKMMGALDDLKTYFDNPEPWIGRQLTVKYQNLSADGLPRFPVALRFREDV
jgi:DNA ligase-1